MDNISKAVSLFENGHNCSQAVLVSGCETFGLPKELALKLASGFGGGIGRTGNICGALSGACMLVGLAAGPADPSDKAAKTKNYERIRAVCNKFARQTGGITCRELLGFDMSTPEGQAASKQPGAFDRCSEFVRIAAQIAADTI